MHAGNATTAVRARASTPVEPCAVRAAAYVASTARLRVFTDEWTLFQRGSPRALGPFPRAGGTTPLMKSWANARSVPLRAAT